MRSRMYGTHFKEKITTTTQISKEIEFAAIGGPISVDDDIIQKPLSPSTSTQEYKACSNRYDINPTCYNDKIINNTDIEFPGNLVSYSEDELWNMVESPRPISLDHDRHDVKYESWKLSGHETMEGVWKALITGYYPPITHISHTFLPSQPQTYHNVIMVKMVPYEGFACPCGAGDVVLRESYKPKTREERVRLLVGSPRASTTPVYSPGSSSTLIYSPGSLTHLRYSPGVSTPQSYSMGTSKNTECSNCKYLHDKITVLEATMDMHMHLEQHTVNSTALFHEVYSNMEKLDLE
nr:ARM repeat superfamily protein [Tanacetum cinerariifolium]